MSQNHCDQRKTETMQQLDADEEATPQAKPEVCEVNVARKRERPSDEIDNDTPKRTRTAQNQSQNKLREARKELLRQLEQSLLEFGPSTDVAHAYLDVVLEDPQVRSSFGLGPPRTQQLRAEHFACNFKKNEWQENKHNKALVNEGIAIVMSEGLVHDSLRQHLMTQWAGLVGAGEWARLEREEGKRIKEQVRDILALCNVKRKGGKANKKKLDAIVHTLRDVCVMPGWLTKDGVPMPVPGSVKV